MYVWPLVVSVAIISENVNSAANSATIVAVFGIPPSGDKALEPRLKAVVMDALSKGHAPCTGVHRIAAARQEGYDAILTAVCMNGASYGIRFKLNGETSFWPSSR